MPTPEEYDYLFKICMQGTGSADGSTSLFHREADGTFPTNVGSTIGVDFKTKLYTFKETTIKLQIWDLASQECFLSLCADYFRKGAAALICVIDLTRQDSMSNALIRIENFKRHRAGEEPVFIIANKSDLKKNITEKELEQFAEVYADGFFICSAKTGAGVNEAFEAICKRVLERQTAPVRIREQANAFITNLRVAIEKFQKNPQKFKKRDEENLEKLYQELRKTIGHTNRTWFKSENGFTPTQKLIVLRVEILILFLNLPTQTEQNQHQLHNILALSLRVEQIFISYEQKRHAFHETVKTEAANSSLATAMARSVELTTIRTRVSDITHPGLRKSLLHLSALKARLDPESQKIVDNIHANPEASDAQAAAPRHPQPSAPPKPRPGDEPSTPSKEEQVAEAQQAQTPIPVATAETEQPRLPPPGLAFAGPASLMPAPTGSTEELQGALPEYSEALPTGHRTLLTGPAAGST